VFDIWATSANSSPASTACKQEQRALIVWGFNVKTAEKKLQWLPLGRRARPSRRPPTRSPRSSHASRAPWSSYAPRIRGFLHGSLRAEPSVLGEEIHGLIRCLPFPVSADVLFALASAETGIEQSSSVKVRHIIFRPRKSFANISQEFVPSMLTLNVI
jgi:hypothetical protein